MENIHVQIFLNSLLYGATAGILSLTIRDIGYFNLASGSWILAGGWLYSIFVGYVSGVNLPVESYWVFVLAILLLGVVHIMLPVVLGRTFKENPIFYLFLSLGVALLLNNVVPIYGLEGYNEQIPAKISAAISPWVYLVVILGIVVSATYLLNTKYYNRLAISVRRQSPPDGVWYNVGMLLLAEVVLLIILGGASTFVHNGMFGSAEYRTIVPLLAALSLRGRPIRSALLASSVVLFFSIVIVVTSRIGSLSLSGYSQSVTIFVLLVFALLMQWHRGTFAFKRHIDSLTSYIDSISFQNDAQFRGRLGSITFLVIISLAAYFAAKNLDVLNIPELYSSLHVLSLSLAGWLAYSYFGVLTIGWIYIGALASYIFLLQSVPYSIILSLVTFYIFAWYTWYIRHLTLEAGIVTDLAVFAFLHSFLVSTPSIVDVQNSRQFTVGLSEILSSRVVALFLIFSIILYPIFAFLFDYKTFRPVTLSLTNFEIGYQHGVRIKRWFLLGIFAFTLVASCSSILFYSLQENIATDTFPLSKALSIILFSFMFERAGIKVGSLIVFLLFFIFPSFTSGLGPVSIILVGCSFVLITFLLSDPVKHMFNKYFSDAYGL